MSSPVALRTLLQVGAANSQCAQRKPYHIMLTAAAGVYQVAFFRRAWLLSPLINRWRLARAVPMMYKAPLSNVSGATAQAHILQAYALQQHCARFGHASERITSLRGKRWDQVSDEYEATSEATRVVPRVLDQEWQSRIAYYHFKKLKAANPCSDLGGFTRVLSTPGTPRSP
eukprot:6209080-Pleurochrysis_carterae.AAC.2